MYSSQVSYTHPLSDSEYHIKILTMITVDDNIHIKNDVNDEQINRKQASIFCTNISGK